MVNVLEVSRSVYYAWRQYGRTLSDRRQRQIERDETRRVSKPLLIQNSITVVLRIQVD